MNAIPKKLTMSVLLAAVTMLAPTSVFAQQDTPEEKSKEIIVTGQQPPEADAIVLDANAPKGPEIKGIIAARNGDRFKVTGEDGTTTIISITDATLIKSSKGFLGINRAKLTGDSLLNGLPVTVKTLQSGGGLVASQINLRNSDFKTANMIRNGTAQGFSEQTAATEALRGRVGDIDQYNIKGTTNVNFDTGKAVLSEQGKADLCTAASTAEGMKNAFILVVGYTDSTGGNDYNQQLSEKRASRVVNHIQQACRMPGLNK